MEIIEFDHQDVMELLPDRDPNGHKGSFGKILLLCGSRGYTGAAALASMGALRSGAGLVYLAVPESIYAIEAVKLTEPVVLPLPDEGGVLSREAASPIRELLHKMDAVLIGPGSGQSEGMLAVLELVLGTFSGPVVVDADGINLLSAHKHLVRGREGITILTPHDGEFIRLAGALGSDRLGAAASLAEELGCIVTLKGHRTLVTDGMVCYRNTTGNPGMAVGGSGDVLAGIMVSLLGQKIPAMEAAAAAVWLHGAAGDRCAQRLGQYGMLPTDMLEELPRLMK